MTMRKRVSFVIKLMVKHSGVLTSQQYIGLYGMKVRNKECHIV